MTDTADDERGRSGDEPTPAIPPMLLTRRQERLFEILLILATTALGIVVIGMVGRIFFDFGDIILTFFLAWLIAFILSPIVRWIIAHVPRLPRVAAVVVVYLLLFTGMIALIVFIAQTLATGISEFIDYFPSCARTCPRSWRRSSRGSTSSASPRSTLVSRPSSS
jgi:predicted PurR-regulated permease PerM